jgi:hypothetical protein
MPAMPVRAQVVQGVHVGGRLGVDIFGKIAHAEVFKMGQQCLPPL